MAGDECLPTKLTHLQSTRLLWLWLVRMLYYIIANINCIRRTFTLSENDKDTRLDEDWVSQTVVTPKAEYYKWGTAHVSCQPPEGVFMCNTWYTRHTCVNWVSGGQWSRLASWDREIYWHIFCEKKKSVASKTKELVCGGVRMSVLDGQLK